VIMVTLSCISLKFYAATKIMSGITVGSKQTYGTSNSAIDLNQFRIADQRIWGLWKNDNQKSL
jgi:hypothetical protein